MQRLNAVHELRVFGTRLRERRLLLSLIKIEREKKLVIDNCLYKIERETPSKRGLSSVQRVKCCT